MAFSGYSHNSPETKKNIQDDRTTIFNQINAHLNYHGKFRRILRNQTSDVYRGSTLIM